MVDAGRERMVRIVGERYADCGFYNFDVGNDSDTPDRQEAKAKVGAYALAVAEHREAGRNLILAGQIGTGKDHLATAVVRAVLAHGFSVAYVRGSVLANQMLATMKGEDLPDKYVTRDFLLISDIEPRGNAVRADFFQSYFEAALLDLIDQRYRSKLPTIITSNAADREAMKAAIGSRTFDRLMECAVSVRMEWPSYRTEA